VPFTAADAGIRTVTITRPASAAEPVTIDATAEGVQLASLDLGDLPVIGAVSPDPAQPAQVVTLTGSGFGAAQYDGSISLSGPESVAVEDNILSWSDTSIQFVLPAQVGGAATYQIAVTKDGHQFSAPILLDVQAAPPPTLSTVDTQAVATISASGPLSVDVSGYADTWLANSSVKWYGGATPAGGATPVTPTIAVASSSFNLHVPCVFTAGGAFGISGGVQLQQKEQQTGNSEITVQFTDSTTISQALSTTITGSFDDDTVRCTNASDQSTCYRPQVVVYLDRMFGSFMFQDPGAPPQS
jgi:hypothetical protein